MRVVLAAGDVRLDQPRYLSGIEQSSRPYPIRGQQRFHQRLQLAVPLGAHCEVTALEIAYAAREEMAVTLADALIRRTEAGSAGHPGQDAILKAADVMAEELSWDGGRRTAEIAAVEAFYQLPAQ